MKILQTLILLAVCSFALCPSQMPSKAITNSINKAYEAKSSKPVQIDTGLYFFGGMVLSWSDGNFYAQSKIDTGRYYYKLPFIEKKNGMKFGDNEKSLFVSENYSYCEHDSLSVKREFKAIGGKLQVIEYKTRQNKIDTILYLAENGNKMAGYVINKRIKEHDSDSLITKENFYIKKSSLVGVLLGKEKFIYDGETCTSYFFGKDTNLVCMDYKDGRNDGKSRSWLNGNLYGVTSVNEKGEMHGWHKIKKCKYSNMAPELCYVDMFSWVYYCYKNGREVEHDFCRNLDKP